MKFSRFKRRGEGNVPGQAGRKPPAACYPNMAPKVSSKRTPRVPRVPAARRTTQRSETAAELMQKIAEEMERLPPETFDGIPNDVSKNVDHYLYGSPKRS